jgi:hypothetical protein
MVQWIPEQPHVSFMRLDVICAARRDWPATMPLERIDAK